jgi:hypothetical protein
VVDGSGLENRHTRKGIGGSNPSLSAITFLIQHLRMVLRNLTRFLRLTLGGHLPPATDQSGASFSSHIRMPFHKVGISGNDGHWCRCAAK